MLQISNNNMWEGVLKVIYVKSGPKGFWKGTNGNLSLEAPPPPPPPTHTHTHTHTHIDTEAQIGYRSIKTFLPKMVLKWVEYTSIGSLKCVLFPIWCS